MWFSGAADYLDGVGDLDSRTTKNFPKRFQNGILYVREFPFLQFNSGFSSHQGD